DHGDSQHLAPLYDRRGYVLTSGNDLINDIRPRNSDVNRQAGSSVENATNFPAAQNGLSGVVAQLDRQFVQSGEIQAVPYVESVVPAVLLEVERVLCSLGFVRSACIPEALSVCPLQ